jgi:DNA excision repair protein ERCC-2
VTPDGKREQPVVVRELTVSVRELVEFVWRTGNLGSQRHFVGTDRALQGIRGHQKIQRSRPPGYETEIAVEQVLEDELFRLRIRGRIDGVIPETSGVVVEEIKTIHGRGDGVADPLHWAQAKCYAHIYAGKKLLTGITVQLTYLELETGKVTEFRQILSSVELAEFFAATTKIYLDWVREEVRWQKERDESLAALSFPFTRYRAGQREMAVMAYKVLANGGRGFVAAPTGIGKTISVLFPAVKALGEGKLRRIYYLTARTVGKTVAEKAMADLRQKGMRLRAVTLTARDKVCVQDGHPCDALTCPLALGYYDRIKPAMRETLRHEAITRETLEAIGTRHQVCPFALAQDVSLWADAVICDYNYVFDPKVYLERHFCEDGGDFGFLVDEAHNLVDRARDMFSEELDEAEIGTVSRAIKTAIPKCARTLNRLQRALKQLAGNAGDTLLDNVSDELELFADKQAKAPKESMTTWGVLRNFPEYLSPLIEASLDEMEGWLARNEEADFREELLTLYFRILAFKRTADLYDEHFVTLIASEASIRIRLLCLNPSRLLRQALNRGKAAIFFSATMTPIDYYRSLCGGEVSDPFLELASPFPPEHLAVLVHDRISTTFKARTNSLDDVVAAIGALVESKAGNYLVYFPSYQYLVNVLEKFRGRFPGVQILEQRPAMNEAERMDFLAAFEVEHKQTLAGFAVLGGIFGEGVDLVGEKLIGAVIVGVGLPQLSVERDLIRDYFEEKSAAGFDYAYTFPGMNRVLQAVGRVIRSETDKGMVLLIDTRFGQARYGRLFPQWWRAIPVRNTETLKQLAKQFWEAELSD